MNAKLNKLFQKLRFKLIGILVVFFLVALVAIGLTLKVSWQFEGGAAAINDAGSERMRSYRLAFLLSEGVHSGKDSRTLRDEIERETAQFEIILQGLERGDPTRPLFLPKNAQIQAQMSLLRQQWQGRIKPLIAEIVDSHNPVQQKQLLNNYRPSVENFVADINRLVSLIEYNNEKNAMLMRWYQMGLVSLAVMGTLVLIYLMYLMIIRPVTTLQEGMRRMAAEDFDVRLPVRGQDEFGELTLGFNRMANHLEDLYDTLEQRVEIKTKNLEEKNSELGILYEIAAFLNEPASVEDLCRGFLRRLMQAMSAQGGAVRLTDPRTQKIYMMAGEGLSDEFIRKESCMNMQDCLCGRTALDEKSVYWDLNQPTEGLLYNCKREGFQVVSAITIRVKKQTIGVFNLYFWQRRTFTGHETQLLETLGQHLGVAVENQRLVSREKEMAVSEERNLLAQELHDSIAQGLAFLNIQVQLLQDSLKRGNVEEAMESLSQIREGVQESYDDVRELLVHFRTRVHQADLDGAIQSALQKFEGQTGIATIFKNSASAAPLSPENEIQVLHIVQEALSNARKHSGATHVEVEIAGDRNYVVTIRDNGKGFDPNDIRDKTETHVGLKIMKERAHRIGGQLEVTTEPGKGTEVRLNLPALQMEAA